MRTLTIGLTFIAPRRERSRRGERPERDAEETDRYETLEGALACLIKDFNLTGTVARPDHPRLF